MCRDLLRLPGCLPAWPVMDFQLRADRVCRAAPQMRPKCRLLPQFSFSFRFSFGLEFRCVACRPIGRVALAACGPQFVNNSLGPVPRCLAWHATSTCSKSLSSTCCKFRCCCPFKGRTLSAAFRGATMPVVLGCCPCLGQLHINHAVLSIC